MPTPCPPASVWVPLTASCSSEHSAPRQHIHSLKGESPAFPRSLALWVAWKSIQTSPLNLVEELFPGPQKAKHRNTIRPSNSACRYVPEELKKVYSHTHVPSNTLHGRWKQAPRGRTDKHNAAQPHQGMWFSRKRDGCADTHYNSDESRKQSSKKPGPEGHRLYDFLYGKYIDEVNLWSQKAGGGLPGAGWGGNREWDCWPAGGFLWGQ